jgi:hypothetical protein
MPLCPCMQPDALFVTPLRQSSVAACLRCKRYAFLRYRAGLLPRRAERVGAASLGKAVHKIMEVGTDAAFLWLKSQTDKLIPLLDNDPLGEVERAIRKHDENWSKARMMCEYFRATYPQPDYLETICAEQKVSVSIAGTPLVLEGTIDLLVRDTRNGACYIRDFKTTSRDTQHTLTGYQYSIQCRLYRLLALDYLYTQTGKSNDLPGVDRILPAFILDVMQVPGIKFCTSDRSFRDVPLKKGEGTKREYYGEPVWGNYLSRCKEWYTENGISAASSFFLTYGEPPITPELSDALSSAGTILSSSTLETAHRDVTRSYCMSYERVCDYYPLCSTSEELWPNIIETSYVVSNPCGDEPAETETETVN